MLTVSFLKGLFFKLGPIAAVTAPAGTPKDVVDTYYFTARGHWELSHTITTNHLVICVTSIFHTYVKLSTCKNAFRLALILQIELLLKAFCVSSTILVHEGPAMNLAKNQL